MDVTLAILNAACPAALSSSQSQTEGRREITVIMKRRLAEMRWVDAADAMEAKITRCIHGRCNTEWIQCLLNVAVDEKCAILELAVDKPLVMNMIQMEKQPEAVACLIKQWYKWNGTVVIFAHLHCWW